MNAHDTTERIRTVFDRNSRALELRPALGRKTVETRIRVLDGLRCEVEEGRWKVQADVSEKSGGTGTAPDAGMLLRSALGSCLAMGYVMWAAHYRVPLAGVTVTMESDFDARGQYGQDGVPAGHSEVRYTVRIESSAPEDDIRKFVEAADRASMVLDTFSTPQKLVRTIEVVRPD